ncbi:DUF5320 domain-containing protein [Methanoculleus sp. UBA430]|uniref:DUF5320 domain-containing protein n=1 Tax=Methanoculleus sp. UBA430 TaxID=1915511 RepID=UPI0025F66BA9|nr:DUF5320 domain-containing protein [Methanoculleus sp. UBA430]
MPGFDGTGPAGAGPMTGGRRGRCSATEAPEGESAAPVLRGLGRGGIPCGCGRGHCGGRARGRR